MTDVGNVQAGAVGTAQVTGRPTIQVVPLKGLPIVAAVVVFVIAAIAGNWLWALTFCHVVGGALWTAIDLFVGLIVGPILARLSLPARAEFTARFMPKMVLLMPTLVLMTRGSSSRSSSATCPRPARITAGWSSRTASSE
jgi:hypothetical protein